MNIRSQFETNFLLLSLHHHHRRRALPLTPLNTTWSSLTCAVWLIVAKSDVCVCVYVFARSRVFFSQLLWRQAVQQKKLAPAISAGPKRRQSAFMHVNKVLTDRHDGSSQKPGRYSGGSDIHNVANKRMFGWRLAGIACKMCGRIAAIKFYNSTLCKPLCRRPRGTVE